MTVPDPIPDALSPYLKTDQEIVFRVLKINVEKCNLHGTIDDETIELTAQIALLDGHVRSEGAPMNFDEF